MANKKITDLMSGTPARDSLLESAIDISGTMDSRKVTTGAIADLSNVNVAAAYNSATTYAIGQYCLYEGDIYRCIAITTGAFDSTAWTQIVVTGEFRRVVELTSAQYTALSSAEKNNGTLYIITDEETTAADIPYSAGVSVADKLDDMTTLDDAIKVVTFTGDTSLTVTAGGVLSVKASDFDYAIPTGYTPIALSTYRFPQTNDIVLVGVDLNATGSTQFGVARNVASANKTSTLTVIVAFARNDLM